jgi:DNA polymerase-3 subunit gamma/tau
VDILGQLRAIAKHEGVIADDAALSLLAEAGDGSMRDALSIMDQAIASAPDEEGHARLDAAQIRELMGTVPNAVFERIFEAVDGNRTAEVMTMANQLLNAGNSPAQLARQCVRYLRNSLMAKVAGLSPDADADGGVGEELLQISPDEQRRAARTAALFGEEELTRFLQTMLRTFDELGYRQEQRFHFELGLMKLVHLRRLLPLEEALSRQSGAAPKAAAQPATRSMPAATPSRPTAATQAVAAPARPAFSPFEQDKNRRRPEASAGGPISVGAVAAPSLIETRGANAVSIAPANRAAIEPLPMPLPAVVPQPEAIPFARPSHLEQRIEQQPDVTLPSPVFETAAASVPPALPTRIDLAANAVEPQQAVVTALAAAKLTSAADAMSDAVWTIVDGEARVQTELSKTMLPVVMNAEAEKVSRAALRGAGILKLALLTGAATPAAEKKARPARSGSAHAKAMEHPMVQQAQKLFNAEIQTVIDLRESD